MHLFEFSLAYAGMTGCCMGMTRHYRQIWHVDPPGQVGRIWKIGGWIFLAAALAACIADSTVAMGFITWLGLCSAAAITLVVLLSTSSRLALAVGPLTAVVAVVAMAVAGWN